MGNRALVLFDFSPQAERALARALRNPEATVEICHVVDEQLYARFTRKGAVPTDTAVRAYLTEYVEKARAENGIDARAQTTLNVARGSVNKVLTEIVGASHADIIYVGGQGHGGFRERITGRTAQRVLRHGKVPTYVVREKTPMREDPRPILCAVDLAPGSEKALARAASIAERERRPLELVCVVEIAAAPYFEMMEIHAAAATEASERDLYEFERRVLGAVRSTMRHVLIGAPPDAIMTLAERRDAGLVVLGSHNHGTLERAILGSTAEIVAGNVRADVLVVR